ncbi:unnamed protein product [Colias eurytheme]|nr:unnamed protein product [Colias eurytheme]
MFTEEQIKNYLMNITGNGEFLKFEFSSADNFIAQIRCDIEQDKPLEFYSTYIDNWIMNFSQFTATAWIAQCRCVKIKTLLLQKVFVCQFAGKGVADRGQLKCKAQIEFKVKLINDNSDLNLFIAITSQHSHNVSSPAPSSVMSYSDVDNLFFEYFDNGFDIKTAKIFHELTLQGKYGSHCLEDPTINPTIEHITFLRNQMQSKDIQRSFTDIMEAKKAYIRTCGGVLTYSSCPEIIVIISPLMKNVITHNNMECVFVDTTVIRMGLVITYLYVSNKIGVLPVACAVHTEDTKTNLKIVFRELKSTIETVHSNFNPKTLIINDLPNQKKAISVNFPYSKINISRWSICCDIWSWLCSDELGLESQRRYRLMYVFKTFVYKRPENLRAFYEKLSESQAFISKPELRNYLDVLWRRSHEWHLNRDIRIHDLTEPWICLLKEFFMRKCRNFDVTMMIDVVTKLLEDYQKNLISKYIDGMPIISSYTNIFHKSDTNRLDDNSFRIKVNAYVVQCNNTPNLYYLQTDTVYCGCTSAKEGILCDHLGLMFSKNLTKVLVVPLLNKPEIELLMKISGRMHEYKDKCELLSEDESPGIIISVLRKTAPGTCSASVRNTGAERMLSKEVKKKFLTMSTRFQKLHTNFLMNPNSTNLVLIKELANNFKKMYSSFMTPHKKTEELKKKNKK